MSKKTVVDMCAQFKIASRAKMSRKTNNSNQTTHNLESGETKEEETKAKVRKVANTPPKVSNDIEIEDMVSVKPPSSTKTKFETLLLPTIENLREMRAKFDAPVDSMGCDKCHDATATPAQIRFQTLLSLMLSSQTKDEVTFAAMARLKSNNCCTVEDVNETLETTLSDLLHPVSFYKNKAKFIKKTALICKEKFDGDIPNTVEGLCSLPGVGPKMAHLCMSSAWDKVTGIGVDTHVHRISNRLGWVHTKNPEETRKGLEAIVPKEMWKEVNHLLVGFGQQICKPVRPECGTCLNRELCPFGMEYILRGGHARKKKLKK